MIKKERLINGQFQGLISFIVIGRNEGKKLIKAINSIYDTIKFCKISMYEIIYVDSNSSDNSVDLVSNYADIKIFRAKKNLNAAIGRNIGANEASGELIFFLDGDMEISPSGFYNIFNEVNNLDHKYISGQINNIYSSAKIESNRQELWYKDVLKSDKKVYTTGGVFLISKELWVKNNGMRTKYKTGEDLDFGLRLAKKDILLLRKKDVIVNHYTRHYFDIDNIWEKIFNLNLFYQSSVLFRSNICNLYSYKRFFRSEYSLVILFIILLGVILIKLPLTYLLLYIFIVMIRSIKWQGLNFKKLLNQILYFIIADILNILSFFIFYPKEKRIFYDTIKNKTH